MLFKLALRNLLGAGKRTWLNVFILSLSYFGIIAMQGIYTGWQEEASRQIIDWEIGSGQLWQQDYDKYDPYSLEQSHAEIPLDIQNKIELKEASATLIFPGIIYPEGRMKNILLKGITADQNFLKIPTKYLNSAINSPQVIIGSRMANAMKLNLNDSVTLRWRDANGSFDAVDVAIAHIFSTPVNSIDSNTIWISLPLLQEMLELPGEATVITMKSDIPIKNIPGWLAKNHEDLLSELNEMIEMKTVGSSIMYLLLLFMSMLAIFDTQILAIFRRRKEMGTMMALGLTRFNLIKLFTLEGTIHAILAIFVGAMYGTPLLIFFTKTGMKVGDYGDSFGLNGVSEYLYPKYGLKLVLVTILIVVITTTITSFLPTRRIARLKPTDALRGRFTDVKKVKGGKDV